MRYLIGLLIAFGLNIHCFANESGNDMKEQPVYKILRESEWKEFQSQGVFHGGPDDLRDGFIHLSPADQVNRVIKKYFATESKVYIVKFSKLEFLKRLTWEPASGGVLYPHLYDARLEIKDVESFEVRDLQCISLSEAQDKIRNYLSPLIGTNFNNDFPWLIEKYEITPEDVIYAIESLYWYPKSGPFFTRPLVIEDPVAGGSHWGEYSIDCQGLVKAWYGSD